MIIFASFLIMRPSSVLVGCCGRLTRPHSESFVAFLGGLAAEFEVLAAFAPGGCDVPILLVLGCPQLVVDWVTASGSVTGQESPVELLGCGHALASFSSTSAWHG
jgi:hypothetical protein